jgi:hypothetical protein
MSIIINTITDIEAADKIQSGGLTWILFEKDTFDADDFAGWSCYYPTNKECEQVQAALDNLASSQALEILVK